MTIQQREHDAECWFVNGADRAVDVYVDYHDEAYASVKPEEDQPVFSIDSDANGTYGTYTFEARAKDDTDGAVLASASVGFDAGDCYTAAFHRIGPDEYQLSIYDTDFSPSGASRFELRHVGSPAQVDWTLAPKEEADPRIPVDERSGTLRRGQWQRAGSVTENEYRLEVLVDGEVVAVDPDLQLEPERLTVCHVVGDPTPDLDADAKQAHVFAQEYHVPAGPERDAETTSPAEPYSTDDENQTIAFDIEVPDLYETNRHEIAVEATDPDGIVDWLELDAVDPEIDGVRLPDEDITRPAGTGEPATASLVVSPEVSPGRYDVRLMANPEGLGERATTSVTLEVEQVTVERLWDLVERYHASGAVTDELANELFARLVDAGASPEVRFGGLDGFLDDVLALFDHADRPGEEPDPREALATVVSLATDQRGDGIDDAASDDLVTETEALLGRLGNA